MDFLSSGHRFFFVQRLFLLVETVTGASGSQLREHILANVMEHIFQPILHSSSWKRAFCLIETVQFYSEFFLRVVTIIETWRKSSFKDKIYSC